MLRLLNEENSELKNRTFPLPDGIRKILKNTLDSYNGDKTIDGYKRLNNLLDMNTVSYHEMKRIKNFFDNYKGTDKSYEFILNGGEPMKNWVNNTLNTATKAIHDFKQAKKDAGMNNAFIKHHEKDRQVGVRNKPTQKKIKTNNVSQNISNNSIIQNEKIEKRKTICINESQLHLIKEAMDDTFTYNELSSIPSFRGRFRYCVQHLGNPVGRGSSRSVFQIDDQKVLKLAINDKGIAQNAEETRAYGDEIFPEVYENDTNYLWMVSEYVLPATAKDFKVCFGLTFNEFRSFIFASSLYRFGDGSRWFAMSEDKYLELINKYDQLAEFDEYIGNYGSVVVGDIVRKCNLGLAQRNGNPTIVLLDAGFTDDVWRRYYKKR